MGFLTGRWGRAQPRYYVPLFILISNFWSSTEIMPSEMEYQVTSSLIYYNKNYKISPMLILIKPLTFLFRCLSDSLSTSMPFDFTGTQKEFTVINLYYQMALFSAPVRQHSLEKKQNHQPLQKFILYFAYANHKVHISTVSLFSSSSCRVMLAAMLTHSRCCSTAVALPSM